MKKLVVPVSLTISRTPAHWLRLTRFPRRHLLTACDAESHVFVLRAAAGRRRYRPDLLACQICQELLDRHYAALQEGQENDLFDSSSGSDPTGQ